MKTLIAKTICLTLLVTTVLLAAFFCAYFVMPPTFNDSYQKGFNYQYHALERAKKQPKIIVFGGSYMNFSVDTDLLSRISNRPTYALGIHSGMGMSYIIECAKNFIRKGDIIIYPFDKFDENDYGTDLIYLCFEKEWKMFKEFAEKHPFVIAKTFAPAIYIKLYNMFHSAFKRTILHKENIEDPTYRASAFDKRTGNFIFPRPSTDPSMPLSELDKKYTYNVSDIPPSCINTLNDLYNFCKNNGANLYITFAPIYNGSVTNSEEEKTVYESFLKNNLDAPIISTLSKNEFPKDCIYNGIRHMNDKGAELYTKQLYMDLIKQ